MREFETGATRNDDADKYDYEGFFSPLVLERRAAYMHRHRLQADGKLRESDNWQKGMPLTAYMKSGWRHFMDWWRIHRSYTVAHGRGEAVNPEQDELEEAICALMFNAEGYLHELLKQRNTRSEGVDMVWVPMVECDQQGKRPAAVGARSPWWPEDWMS